MKGKQKIEEKEVLYLKDEKVLELKKKEVREKIDNAVEMLRRGMTRRDVANALGVRLDFVAGLGAAYGLPSAGRSLKDYFSWLSCMRVGKVKSIRIPAKAFDLETNEFKIESLDREKKTMVVAWR